VQRAWDDPSSHLKPPQPAKLAHHAGLCECAQPRHGTVGQPPLLVGEVLDEFCAVVVMLADVVVVDCLLDQPSERMSASMAAVAASAVRKSGSPSISQTTCEHEPAGLDRFDHLAQDVHDVLRIDSSE
jgi:hypothetical protein